MLRADSRNVSELKHGTIIENCIMKKNRSLLLIDLGGTKIRYLHYHQNSEPDAHTTNSPRSPTELISFLRELYKHYPSDQIYLGVPGPMPLDCAKTNDIFLPPLNFTVNINDLTLIKPTGSKLFIANDMFSYAGILKNSLKNKIGVLAIGTSTGFGTYKLKNNELEFHSFEVAHEKANRYMPVKACYNVNEILSGTALDTIDLVNALNQDNIHNYNLDFTFMIECFCSKIAMTQGINEIYLVGGGLLKAYGEEFVQSSELKKLSSNCQILGIKLKVISDSFNYLLESAKILKKHDFNMAGTGILGSKKI